MRTTTLVIGAAALAFTLLCAPVAYARTYTEGTGENAFTSPGFSDTVMGESRGAQGVVLERKILWEYSRPGVLAFSPFAAQPLADGSILIADRDTDVIAVNRAKRITWDYGGGALKRYNSAQRLPNGNTLIADRNGYKVVEIDASRRIVWSYGIGVPGLSAGHLVDPYSAWRIPGGYPGAGNTLICDNRGGNRVIEVSPTGNIVWSYGEPGVCDIGPGQLVSPRSATRLPNGNTLICDSAMSEGAAHRVIIVDSAGGIVWRFGVDGVAGTDDKHLNAPSSAEYLPDTGGVLIGEEDGNRVLEVDADGKLVDVIGSGPSTPSSMKLSKVRSVQRSASGTTIIADQGHKRVIEVGYPASGMVTSGVLDLGLPGVKKIISRLEPDVVVPKGTSYTTEYALDGGSFKTLPRGGTLPAKTYATTLRYRVTLKAAHRSKTPVLRSMTITFDVAPTGKPNGGSSKNDSSKGGSGESTSTAGPTTSTRTVTAGVGAGRGRSGSGASGTRGALKTGGGTGLLADLSAFPPSGGESITRRGTLLSLTRGNGGPAQSMPAGVAQSGTGVAGGVLALSFLAGLSSSPAASVGQGVGLRIRQLVRRS